MSDDIRRYLNHFVDANVTDDVLERIRQILMIAPGKHKVPLTLKFNFHVSEEGHAKISASMTTTLSVPAWDEPIRITGQLGLFSEPTPYKQVVDPPRQRTRVQTIAPAELNAVPPVEKVVEQAEAGLSLSPEAQLHLDKIETRNMTVLAEAEKSGAQIAPDAQKKLREWRKRQGA